MNEMKTSIIKIGDHVSFLLVNRRVKGTVVEDLGKLARGGRHIYSVKVNFDSTDPMIYPLTEGEFEVLQRGASR
jgi:hypothetical protein